MNNAPRELTTTLPVSFTVRHRQRVQHSIMSEQEYTLDEFFPTKPWLESYQAAINADEEYAEKGAGWGVDFEGAFLFHITDIPLSDHTVGDLPDVALSLIDDRFDELSEDEIERIAADAPDEIRSSIEERDGGLSESIHTELLETPLDETDRVWPELESALPSLVTGLFDQLEQYIVDGDTVYTYLDLYDSECREVDIIGGINERDNGFVIHGEYADWKDLVQGNAGVIDQLMGGVMELDGDMQKVLQYSDAAVRLTDLATEIESRFLF